MKNFIFYLLLCFLFLGNKSNSCAARYSEYTINNNLEKHNELKFKNSHYKTLIFDDADLDLDLEEEYLNSDNTKSFNEHKFCLENYNLISKYSFTDLSLLILNNYHKSFKIPHLSYKNLPPIYILIRVLRI